MGGINHQPCSEYDPQAILLSNTLSQAYSKFWSGNGKIEDALSFEIGKMLDQAEFAFLRARADIKESFRLIEVTRINMDRLLRLMEKKSFQDLPSLSDMDFTNFKEKLEIGGLFPKNASLLWQLAVNSIKEGGYRKMFVVLKGYFTLLLEKTQQFLDILEQAEKLIKKGEFQESFNKNKFSEFKRTFGSLFCTWNEVLCVFYFSSLISLESWYIQHRYSSVIGNSKKE